VDVPSLEQLTAEVLAYWRTRAERSPHPVLRARYADLLWEMPQRLAHAQPDAAMARAAVDAYLDAVAGRRYAHPIERIARGRRALHVALKLKDAGRAARARDGLLALEAEVGGDDDHPGLWGFCFDLFVAAPPRGVEVTDAVRDQLVADQEARLARFVERPPAPYKPIGAEAAVLRLARYYRRADRLDDAARVLRAYGTAILRMRGTAGPFVLAHEIEALYDLYQAFGLRADADALNAPLRAVGQEAAQSLQRVTVSTEVPGEQVEAYYAALLAEPAAEVLPRVAVQFVPQRQTVEARLREGAKHAPLTFLMTHVITDDEGRTVARVGPLAEDLEGHVMRAIAEDVQVTVPWLREAMRRGFERAVITADALLDFLLASPLFQEKRRPVLQAGLEAFARADATAAIHILVPQAEQALRQMALGIGASLYEPRRGGGVHVRTLDTLLRDADVAATLGPDIASYLRALLTDPRGWNLRNTVCHGLAPASAFSLPVADRVVHALLVLALFRYGDGRESRDAAGSPDLPGDDADAGSSSPPPAV